MNKYIFILFLIYIFILFYGFNKKMEFFDKELNSFVIKKIYNPVIPLNLFVTWHTKDLPEMMKKNYESLKSVNPEFNHYLYDNNDCREFIKNNYDKDVLEAFDTLVPGAYKADLWRCCVLYKKGGMYLDIKFNCINGFKLIILSEKEYFVRDRLNFGIYNAFMVCKAGNKILHNIIREIVHNTQTKFYGINSLHPTGPYLFKKYFDNETINKLELFNSTPFYTNKNTITYGNTKILASYDEYRVEQSKFQNELYYGILWKKKKIYRNI
jgi:mannosyltransferase OCH1-like enzyme